MTRVNRRRLRVCLDVAVHWFCLLLITINLLAAPLVAADAAKGSDIVSVEASLGVGEMVICTGHGFIVIGEDGKPVDHDGNKGHAEKSCYLCLPLMQVGKTMAVADIPLPLPSFLNVPKDVSAAEFRVEGRSPVSSNPPRAPPIQS